MRLRAHIRREHPVKPTDNFNCPFDLKELVRTIGYRLTAHLGRTTVPTVVEWLKKGLPNDLEERMRAAFDVGKPTEGAESELVTQGLLSSGTDAFLNHNLSITACITSLRDTTDVLAVRKAGDAGQERISR
jgi:hypothetical protein